MTPAPSQLFEAIEATWPAAEVIPEGVWLLRDGKGGGKRVSAATAMGPVSDADIAEAEAAMARLGQRPLFRVREGEAALDALLAARGYGVLDPTDVLVLPVARLTDVKVPPVTTFTIWEPLAIMRDIWAQGGIGPARIEVMARATCKTGILARWNEKPAGVGFVAVQGNVAMVHAVEVLPQQRRQGVAGWIMRAAAFWAQAQGAQTLVVLCTQANGGAQRLYSALGFVRAGHYHYRQRPTEGGSRHD
jgi:GNAT superfamily N-acetyltransferase